MMMARTCTICAHSDSGHIDAGLVSGRSLRDLSQEFSVSHSALHRHRASGHIAEAMRASAQRQTANRNSVIDERGPWVHQSYILELIDTLVNALTPQERVKVAERLDEVDEASYVREALRDMPTEELDFAERTGRGEIHVMSRTGHNESWEPRWFTREEFAEYMTSIHKQATETPADYEIAR